MTRLEYLTCRVLVADTGREAPAAGIAFYRSAGWDLEALEHYRARFGKLTHALPDSFRRLQDSEHLRIGEHGWRVITGNGHPPEHACFHLATSFIALLIAVPVSFSIALFLTEMAPLWLKRPIGTAIELLAAAPSIVYGM